MQYKEKNVQLCGLMMIGLFIYTFGSSLLLHFFLNQKAHFYFWLSWLHLYHMI